MFVVIGILIGLGAGAALAFIGLYALTGSRLAAARRTRQLLLTEARREAEAMRRETQIEAREQSVKLRADVELGPDAKAKDVKQWTRDEKTQFINQWGFAAYQTCLGRV